MQQARNIWRATTTGTGKAIGTRCLSWFVESYHSKLLTTEFTNSGVALCRSPWSNEYDPPLDDGTVPSSKLRKLEITANEAFDTYREMYV